MTTQPTHTQTPLRSHTESRPWSIEAQQEIYPVWVDGYLVGYAINRIQADNLCKAVNAYGPMREALKEIIDRETIGGSSLSSTGVVAQQAIAKAEGK